MIRRQTKTILFVLLVALVLGGTLAVLFSTVWKETPGAEEQTEFMVEPLGMEEISEITVKNREHSYRLYRGEDGEIYFEGAEYVLYRQNMIAYLRSSVAYLAVSGKVDKPEDMAEYGLTEEACQCDFSVTSTEGETYRVLIGDELVSAEGYYARLIDSEEVYVLASSLQDCLFGDVNFFLSGQVATALSEDQYYQVTDFHIEREGKPFVTIELIAEDEKTEDDISTHRVVYPARYEPNTDLVSRIFKSFVSFVGEEVVAYDLAEMEPEAFAGLMEEYGFVSDNTAEMYCRVSYSCQGLDTELFVSRVDEEKGVVYVYSPGFDIIAAFAKESLAWVEYDLMEYTQTELYARSVDRIASIGVKGAEIDTVFTLTHGEKASDLRVRSERGEVDTHDFRQFYTQLLYVKNGGYADVPDNYQDSESLRLTITRRSGEAQEFVFYDIETRKSYYTVDGQGVFYVNRDYVKALLTAAAQLLSGESVTAVQFA